MGAAASIEDTASLEKLDYNALKAKGLDFGSAYSAIQKKAKVKSRERQADVHFLAIRQLSQTLQKNKEENIRRKKFLKSQSLPSAAYQKIQQQNSGSGDAKADNSVSIIVEGSEDAKFGEEGENVVVGAVESKPEPVKKPKKKRPSLMLQVEADENNGGDASEIPAENDPSAYSRNGEAKAAYGETLKPDSPSQRARVSPRGTLHMGNFKVMEHGIFAESQAHLQTFAGTDSGDDQSGDDNSDRCPHLALPALGGGKHDFIEIGKLGSGASGVVSEAIHVPSMTLVALKMLPIYNQQKRQHVSRELGVLYHNLSNLRLVDDTLSMSSRQLYRDMGLAPDDDSETDPANNNNNNNNSSSSAHRPSEELKDKLSPRSSCQNILSLYNAFVDPKTGMINLVIEYMDGGSLEDLVELGGCRDEALLADIARQTLQGLRFLHNNKHMHRDIKPANILCSSTGIVKIGDFGISKALDKTSGFANSFVGTVCYMSPERITGGSYSFSSDIWSFGLTLLAVAEGEFPLSGKEGSPASAGNGDSEDAFGKKNAPVGGAGGYWAMIKAICDEDPPKAGPRYSTEFNEFIAACLRKEPSERLQAEELLKLPFIVKHTRAKERSRRGLLDDSESAVHASSRGRPPLPDSARAGAGAAAKAVAPLPLGPRGESDPGSRDPVSARREASSPLSARLATAAIVRRTSQDSSALENMLAAVPKDLITEREEKPLPPTNESEDAQDDEEAEANGHADERVITAIRMEHLDRVLERIRKKIVAKQRRTCAEGSGREAGAGGGEEGELEESDDDDDDFDLRDDIDFKDIHNFNHLREFGSPGDAARNAGPIMGGGGSSMSRVLVVREDSGGADSKGEFGGAPPMSPTKLLKQQNSALSILKGSTSYLQDHVGLMAGGEDPGSPLMPAEEKKARFQGSKAPIYDPFGSSLRSVHFGASASAVKAAQDNQSEQQQGLAAAESSGTNKLAKAKKKLATLQLQDDEDEEEGEGGSRKEKSVEHNHVASRRGHGNQAVDLTAKVVDYRKMLPKLNRKGMAKWENLAKQLHLSLHLVRLAVIAKLGKEIELMDGTIGM